MNADLIAAGLAPFAPETAALQAGRLMLQELDKHFHAGISFAFETTLSGRAYLRLIDPKTGSGSFIAISKHNYPIHFIQIAPRQSHAYITLHRKTVEAFEAK